MEGSAALTHLSSSAIEWSRKVNDEDIINSMVLKDGGDLVDAFHVRPLARGQGDTFLVKPNRVARFEEPFPVNRIKDRYSKLSKSFGVVVFFTSLETRRTSADNGSPFDHERFVTVRDAP
jgi:hypothetical protein